MARIDRTDAKPTPADWADDDPMTLAEFAQVFGDKYPITVSGMRTAVAKGELVASRVAGSLFVTPNQVRELFRPRINPRGR